MGDVARKITEVSSGFAKWVATALREKTCVVISCPAELQTDLAHCLQAWLSNSVLAHYSGNAGLDCLAPYVDDLVLHSTKLNCDFRSYLQATNLDHLAMQPEWRYLTIHSFYERFIANTLAFKEALIASHSGHTFIINSVWFDDHPLMNLVLALLLEESSIRFVLLYHEDDANNAVHQPVFQSVLKLNDIPFAAISFCFPDPNEMIDYFNQVTGDKPAVELSSQFYFYLNEQLGTRLESEDEYRFDTAVFNEFMVQFNLNLIVAGGQAAPTHYSIAESLSNNSVSQLLTAVSAAIESEVVTEFTAYLALAIFYFVENDTLRSFRNRQRAGSSTMVNLALIAAETVGEARPHVLKPAVDAIVSSYHACLSEYNIDQMVQILLRYSAFTGETTPLTILKKLLVEAGLNEQNRLLSNCAVAWLDKDEERLDRCVLSLANYIKRYQREGLKDLAYFQPRTFSTLIALASMFKEKMTATLGDTQDLLLQLHQLDYHLMVHGGTPSASCISIFNNCDRLILADKLERSVAIYENVALISSPDYLNRSENYRISILTTSTLYLSSGIASFDLDLAQCDDDLLKSNAPNYLFQTNIAGQLGLKGEKSLALATIEKAYATVDSAKIELRPNYLMLIYFEYLFSTERKCSIDDIIQLRKNSYSSEALQKLETFVSRLNLVTSDTARYSVIEIAAKLKSITKIKGSRAYTKLIWLLQERLLSLVFNSWYSPEYRLEIVNLHILQDLYGSEFNHRLTGLFASQFKRNVQDEDSFALAILLCLKMNHRFSELRIDFESVQYALAHTENASLTKSETNLPKPAATTETIFSAPASAFTVQSDTTSYCLAYRGLLRIRVIGAQRSVLQSLENAHFQSFIIDVVQNIHQHREKAETYAAFEEEKRRFSAANLQLARNIHEQASELAISKLKLARVIETLNQGIVNIIGRKGELDPDSMTKTLQDKFPFFDPALGNDIFSLFFTHGNLSTAEFDSLKSVLQISVGGDIINFIGNSNHLPKRLKIAATTYEIEYIPIIEAEIVDQILVSIRDITQQKLERRQAERDQLTMRMINEVVEYGIERSFQLLQNLFAELNQLDLAGQLMPGSESYKAMLVMLHTFKGSMRTGGFREIASQIHEVESKLKTGGGPEFDETLTNLQRVVKRYSSLISDRFYPVLSTSRSAKFMDDFDQLMAQSLSADEKITQMQLARRISQGISLRELLIPIEKSLATIAAMADKERPLLRLDFVACQPEQVYLAPTEVRRLEGILTHLITNSIDHGFASQQVGEIHLNFHYGETVRLTYEDKGSGLCSSLLPADDEVAQSDKNLFETIFSRGYSSKSEVSQLSGRGVGMAAVLHLTQAMGGQIEIHFAPEEIGQRRKFWLTLEFAQNLFIQLPQLKASQSA